MAGSCQCTNHTHSPALRVPYCWNPGTGTQLGRPVRFKAWAVASLARSPHPNYPVVQIRPGSLYSHYSMGIAPEPLDQAFWDLETKPHRGGRH